MNKLRGMRCYLGGAMEFSEGCGVEWRQQLIDNYDDFGIIWLDPTDKPIDLGIEDIENHERRKELKKQGEFDQVRKEMKLIRCVDLRMVDLSDFLVFNIDITTYTTGTIEEITTANRQKKPIIIRIKQGKSNCPDWLLAMIPHEMIFGSWASVYDYLDKINSGKDSRHFKRWFFFDLEKEKEKEKERLERWEKDLAKYEGSLMTREWRFNDFDLREKKLASQEKRLIIKEKDFESKEKKLEFKAEDFKSLEECLMSWKKKLDSRTEKLNTQEGNLKSRRERLDIKEKRLESEEKDLGDWKKNLDSWVIDFTSKQRDLESKAESLASREGCVRSKEKRLDLRGGELRSEAKDFDTREESLDARAEKLESWANNLKSREERLKDLDSQTKCLESWANNLGSEGRRLKSWGKDLESKEKKLGTRDIESQEKDLREKRLASNWTKKLKSWGVRLESGEKELELKKEELVVWEGDLAIREISLGEN